MGGQAVPSRLRRSGRPLSPRARGRLDRARAAAVSQHAAACSPRIEPGSARSSTARSGTVWLAGHSMGGALAVLAAAEQPERIARLTLISPAGLPLQKSMTASLADFARQVVSSRATPGPTRWSRSAAHSPRRARRSGSPARCTRSTCRSRWSGCAGAAVRWRWSPARPTRSSRRRTAAVRRSCSARDYRRLPLPGGHMWMLDRARAAGRRSRRLR